jgi:hypothetical protein
MVYSTHLQTILYNKLNNITENGNIVFTNVTSKYLPNVSSFLSFWEKHITIIAETNNDDEYEIDEILSLCKMTDQKNSQLTDNNIIKMICHYFSPHVEVIENKYVTNIKCNLWCKHDDINEYLNYYKSNLLESENINNSQLLSFDDLYQGYKLFFKAKSSVEDRLLPIVSKDFFEKFLMNQLGNYIKFEKFVSCEWLLM